MGALTRLWFIRHGEVEAPFVGTFVGSTDVALSDVGRHQAQAVASFLEPMELDALLSSPLRRARTTAVPTERATGLRATQATWAQEMHFGDWEGKSWPDIEAADPEGANAWQADPANIACPGGDAAGEFAERVQAGLAEMLDEFRGRAVALFAHAGTNRAILSAITQRPYMESFLFAQDYGCVNAAAWDGPQGQVALLNAVPGPKSEDNGDGGRSVDEV